MSISLTVMGDSILKGTVFQGGRYVTTESLRTTLLKTRDLSFKSRALRSHHIEGSKALSAGTNR